MITKIMIDNKPFTKEEVDTWRLQHAKSVYKTLNLRMPDTSNVDEICQCLTEEKLKLSYDAITSEIKNKLALGDLMMKMASKFSLRRRKKAITTLYATGITAEKFNTIIDQLMTKENPIYTKVNINVCPEHYVLKSHGDTLEVIEKTGNAPVPTRFFITFNDVAGIEEPRDTSYPYQSTGIAKLKDGTLLGGVRHQFKDIDNGFMIRTLVEFPSLCPTSIVKDHQKHLAVEWSGWINWAIEHQDEFQ